ncbi:MAG: ATP-dependent Clp protease ATP-binding subunit [Clostridia bacterium]|nr:ATP-dependent Clp protease ATP-binding subunit [Clostridia bacterium]
MVNRFTPKAHATLTTAKRCAEKMGHSYIGSEHLILGILSCDCVGKKFLEDKKITYKEVYARLTEIAGIGNEDASYIRELTPKCKRVIELSATFAKKFGTKLIGTEHLLLGICEECESVGGRILTSLGINLQALKNEVIAFLDGAVKEFKEEKGKIPASPTLSTYGKSLNEQARLGKYDPLIGRETELDRLIQVLCRRTKNNPCLIGEPGVGKTAIVEGLAQKINDKMVPEELLDKTVVSLDLSSMIAGAKYRGEFEERLKNALNEIKNNNNLILFIDEIHTIIGAGAAEGAIDAASIIKPCLARGHIQIIGATTLNEYRTHIEKDTALERRFQPITVKEPSQEEAVQILEGLQKSYEEFHGIDIPKSLLQYTVKMSIRYIPDRFLPDKAIDIIDEACSRVKMSYLQKNTKLETLKRKLNETKKEKELCFSTEKFEKVQKLSQDEQKIKQEIELAMESENGEKKRILTKKDIDEVLSLWTSVPITEPSNMESKRFTTLENDLNRLVIGQKDAVRAVAASIKRGQAGLKNPFRPIGSFLFLGPTGVGKTELAKALAKTVFGKSGDIIRLDMTEYMEKHSVSRLIGSPPGYVGYDDGGVLTKAIRKSPYSVVLFDEIEKAHPDLYNILLQILDEGALTDSHGRTVSFKNAVIILTSNVGAKSIVKTTSMGFDAQKSELLESQRISEQVTEALKREFNPELINRLDEVVVFNKLTKDDTVRIANIMLDEVKKLCSDIGIDIKFGDSVAEHIADEGFSKEYGARPIRRTIMKLVENPLSDKILSEEIKKGDSVSAFFENGDLKFKVFNTV